MNVKYDDQRNARKRNSHCRPHASLGRHPSQYVSAKIVITHLILWLLFGHVCDACNNASNPATDDASCSGDRSLRMLSDVVGLICEDSWDAILHKSNAFYISISYESKSVSRGEVEALPR